MTLRELTADWLKSHGYEGLFDPDECACEVSDLMPCDEPNPKCEPGIKTKCDCGEHDFHIEGRREVKK